MLNIAIFVSGRVSYYKDLILPLIKNINKKYNILLFFSINTFSEPNISDQNINNIISDIRNTFGENIGEIQFEKYKMPRSYVDNRIKNNINLFYYNSLSCFYNDKQNFNLIENYEIKYNMTFDIICKVRTDIRFTNNDLDFIPDNKNDLIIRNKHIQDIRYWGHIYNQTPCMVSDAFAYGNKKSMKIYCSTYDWILKNDIEMNGSYSHAPEIYLTDSILEFRFYNIPGGGQVPVYSSEEIIDKYNNNPHGIKIIYLNDVFYEMLPSHIRSAHNFKVDMNNVLEYTQS